MKLHTAKPGQCQTRPPRLEPQPPYWRNTLWPVSVEAAFAAQEMGRLIRQKCQGPTPTSDHKEREACTRLAIAGRLLWCRMNCDYISLAERQTLRDAIPPLTGSNPVAPPLPPPRTGPRG